MNFENYRMYILVKDEFPGSVAINSAAHGAMGAYKLWHGEEDFDGWEKHSYRKITCKVTPEQFKTIEKVIEKTGLKKLEQTENRLDKAHILTVVYPFDPTLPEYKAFKYLTLWREIGEINAKK